MVPFQNRLPNAIVTFVLPCVLHDAFARSLSTSSRHRALGYTWTLLLIHP